MWPIRTGSHADRKLRARIARASPAALADAPDGARVCIRGVVRELVPLVEAPLGGDPCVYYASHVALSLGNLPGWRHHTWREGSVAFIVEGASGHRAVVDPRGAEVSVRFDRVTRSAAAFDADARQRALLGLKPIMSWLEVSSVHYYEGVIALGTAIAVVGTGTRAPDPDAREAGGYREAPTRLQFAASHGAPLWICDHPDDQRQ
jgi:hypothetical protein